MLMRCTGVVRKIEERSGIAEEGTPKARSWRMHTVRILVGDADFADVVIGREVPLPRLGEEVDYQVEVEVGRDRGYGAKLRATATGTWPYADAAAAGTPVAAGG